MINLLLCCIIFSINITPKNIFWDHYSIVPPLGRIKSLVTSPLYVFAISDNYLLMFDKQNLNIKKTIHFDQDIDLVGYDQYYNDLWIISTSGIIRFTIASYNVSEYPAVTEVDRFGIGQNYLYLDGTRDYSLNKRTGEVKIINSFPGNLVWYKKTTGADIKNYTFLTPYYYFDELEESQAPFHQFPITAIYDDGMYLYVGTDRYGILKYNKISWQKQRVIYGPLDSGIRKAKKFDNNIYFISSLGLSYYPAGADNWKYQRFTYDIADVLPFNNYFIVSFGSRISRASGGVIFTISNFSTNILCLSQDKKYLYVGTNSGLFKIAKEANIPMPFGPDRYAVYVVYPMDNEIFVGSETGFYKYNREFNKWLKEISFGVKDIVELKGVLYLLGVNNQVIKYQNIHKDSADIDTSWFLLPYFNIYDIDTDDKVLYCASYAGINYYDPDNELYNVIYNLPRIKYDYVFVVDNSILAVSNKNIYSLPLKYRD
jgi:hypothetical protein